MKGLRILVFESLMIVAMIYALGAMINRHYSPSTYIAMGLALTAAVALPEETYPAK